MEMEIEQRSWAIGAKFDIETPAGSYTASRGLFTVLAGFELADPQGQSVAKIQKRFSPFKAQYTITLADGTVYSLKNQSIWTGTYACEGNGEQYAVYSHRGRNFSIFKSGRQIASFAHQVVTVLGGNLINIRADDNCNVALVIGIVLCVEAPQDDTNKQAISFDLGKIGPEERPFDSNWEPNRAG